MKKQLATLLLISAFATHAAPAPKVPAQTMMPRQATTVVQQSNAATARLLAHEETRVIAFYDANWQISEEPVDNGFYRMLLGHTAQGNAVIQDFYQQSRTKQVDPVALAQGKALNDSNSSAVVDGKTIWYTPTGEVEKVHYLQSGKITYSGRYAAGKLRWAVKQGDESGKGTSLWAYYPSGKLLAFAVVTDNQTSHHRLFDEQGRFLADSNQVNKVDGKSPQKAAAIHKAASLYTEILRELAQEMSI